MLEIESFDEETVNELRNAPATCSLTEPSSPKNNWKPSTRTFGLEGMDKALAAKLAQGGVHTATNWPIWRWMN